MSLSIVKKDIIQYALYYGFMIKFFLLENKLITLKYFFTLKKLI